MLTLPAPLAPLAEYRQFILWVAAERSGKVAKLPVDYRTGKVGDAHDPGAWLDAPQALQLAQLYGPAYGAGFVFTEHDPFFFLDIDNCLQPDGASWSPLAMQMLSALPGTAVEVSQSGKGLHVFGRGTVPPHSPKNTALGLELYTQKRFVALTGTNAIGDAAVDMSAQLPAVVSTHFVPKAGSPVAVEWSTVPVPQWTGPESDIELVTKAKRSRSAAGVFGAKATFAQLWGANEAALSKCYPAPEGDRSYDASSADAALAQHLAFWTGNNCERIRSLMMQSALVRDKWEREDYLVRTVTFAVGLQTTVYSTPKRVPMEQAAPPLGDEAGKPQMLSGYQYLGATQQLEYFEGCIYVQELHRIFTPGGALLKPEQFNATYGGCVFQMDETGKTSTKAWEVLTNSQLIRFSKAEGMCFRPAVASGAIFGEEGRRLVNTYVPIDTPRQQGDAGPFIEHLRRMLPDDNDRAILLAYMAACIQHKGVKFQWAPLIQGIEGNGKTLFTRCVAAAIGRRYVHFPKASDLDNKFNGWLLNRLFIGIEDIYVPAHRLEILETLKPMITGGDGLEIQLKGVDQITADVCCNFMLNSNHKDAVLKTETDRRFAVFYTAQQAAGDLSRDGMTGEYFPRLYQWLRGGGYAIVAHFLEGYAIPEHLNPATLCHRAPTTSSTPEAIVASLGGVEQQIIEAIDEGRLGFRGGWVSSTALGALLQSINATHKVPPNRRRALLNRLGYEWHPGLTRGRVNNPIDVSGTKPYLFIKRGHDDTGLLDPRAIGDAYQAAQTLEPEEARPGTGLRVVPPPAAGVTA